MSRSHPRPHQFSSAAARSGSFSIPSIKGQPWLGRWLARNLWVGTLLGVFLATTHQLVELNFASPASDGMACTTWERALGVVLVVALYQGVFLASSALAGFLLRGAPMLRRVAALKMGIVMSALVGAHVLAEVVYASAGAYLTVGALDFFANGMEHMVRAVVDDYTSELFGLVALTVLVVLLAGAALYNALHDPFLSPRRLGGGLAVGLGLVWGVNQLVDRDPPDWAGVWATSPELAFLSSVYSERQERREFEQASGLRPEPGRPRTSARLWDTATARTREGHPNVLLIMLESVSASHLGYAGYHRGVTPNLDRIARRSLRFTRVWTTATHSNYAQMAVLSSLFPRRTAGLDTYERLDYPRELLHDFLYALHYETATISSQDETWQGMDRFQATGTPTLFLHAGDSEGKHLKNGIEDVVPDELTAERAMRWIAAQRGHPWGLYVNFQMTHFPYRLPKTAEFRFSPWRPDPAHFRYLGYPQAELSKVINKYDNALLYVDRQVGRIYDFLRENGLAENTILVVTSDHGELFHQHGLVTHGRSLYDAEARVPLMIHWPARLEPAVSSAPASHLDIMPTLADLLEAPPHPSFQGRSLVEDEAPERRNQHAIFMNNQGMRSADAIVCWPYKLIKDRQKRRPELYDLERDPEERYDLYSKQRERASRLRKILRAQLRAQLEYHHPKHKELRKQRYAPRMLSCDATERHTLAKASQLR